MNESARYIKIVEWSDEDQCFVGQCPGIIGPCCHGTDEAQVYAELCQIVDEWIETLKKDGKPLPPPTAGKDLAKKLSDAALNRLVGVRPGVVRPLFGRSISYRFTLSV